MTWTRAQKKKYRRLARRLRNARPTASFFWPWSTRISIYVLIEEESIEIKYVGRSINLPRRMRSHRRNGRGYVMLEIDVIPQHMAQRREQYWIDKIKSWGYHLENEINAKRRN